jgi:hypothetical protein
VPAKKVVGRAVNAFLRLEEESVSGHFMERLTVLEAIWAYVL